MAYFQTNTITPPETIPAMAPALVVRFQNSANSTSGPNAAPKPAHAKDTTRKMELSSSSAMKTAITEMMMTDARAISIAFFWESFTLKKEMKISCEAEEDAAKSCESAVDIVAARIPERITPATSAGKMPKELKCFEISMMMRSPSKPSWRFR